MLAIVIPYYKRTFFDSTLQSLANQTDKRFKVYIGDDDSPENPSVLLEKYKGQFDFVYHRFENNIGGTSLTQQWERCIKLTNDEEWLMILGDDDVLGDNVVEEFYKNLPEIEKEKINVVRFASQSIDFVRNEKSKVFKNPRFEKASDSFYRRFSGLTRSSLSEYVFSKNMFSKYKFKNYPLAWHTDDYAWIEFSEKKPILSINEAIVFVKVSSESLTGKTINLFDKKMASSSFYFDIIQNKLELFNTDQRLKLLLKAETSTKLYRELTFKEWCILGFHYKETKSVISVLKLVRRFFKSI